MDTDVNPHLVSMQGLLQKAAHSLCHALEEMLPILGSDWWGQRVYGKLSFRQQEAVERQGIDHLEQLDLAALLRVLDQNWFELVQSRNWPYESRNFVKEMQTVRNRWAHAQVAAPSGEDIYRDLDTLQRFLILLAPDDPLLSEIREAKETVLSKPPSPYPETALQQQAASQPERQTTYAPGDVVRLRANPSKSGAVIAAMPGEKETRYHVFLDGGKASYYESQLMPGDFKDESMTVASLREFHAHLTALQLLHPGISNLYSLHAARIELIPYQFRPVLKFIRSDRPRLLIADSVGVGKTIEAGLILRELQARRDIRRVLIACPRPLVTEEKWRREMKRFDERFEHLDGPKLRHCISEMDLDGEWPQRYEKAILPFSLLTDEVLHGSGKRRKGLLQLDPPPQFDLVVVDEAHHIRNTNTQRHEAIRFFCENAEAVVFLTATPIQMSDNDLFVLLNTLRPDIIIDKASYGAITEPNAHINQAALCARKGGPGWAEEAREALTEAAGTPWGRSVLRNDPRFQEVFDSLAHAGDDRAVRVHAIRSIEQLHTLSGLMNRTLRRDIGEFTQRKPQTVTVEFTPEQKSLHDAVIAAQAAVYAELHGVQSVRFLLTTIRRQAASCIQALAPFLQDILSRRFDELDCLSVEEGEDDGIDLDIDRAAPTVRQLIDDALRQAETLPCDPDADPKFLALKGILEDKQALPNNKVMLFSSFRHTLAYLYKALQDEGFRVGLIHGGVGDDERVALRARFETNRDDAEALDVLLFSEVGCEGLDYQFCDCMVNYDLPWNPMRIDQRIGRIDRWGQTSEAVAIYNLITPDTIDAEIYERCLLRIGVFERALGANEAILGEVTREITSVAENLSLSPAERQAKLEQLADNSIRLVKEQQDLETRQTELFGLRMPADQFKQDIEDASSYWLSATSLERLVVEYLRGRAGKEESPLSGDGPKKRLRLAREVREALLKDFAAIENRTSPIAREWETWLKGNEPNLAVTFDSACAVEDRTICLITPIHPLAVQAARTVGGAGDGVPVVGIRVSTDAVSPGDYPFAVYQWQYHGIRDDVEFRPVTTNPALTGEFLRLLADAEGFEVASDRITEETRNALESRHYEAWSDARAGHIENTQRVAEFRRSSLDTSHKARMAVLDSQLAEARNDKIRTMKSRQKENAQADFDRHISEIEEATQKADITTRPVGWGMLRVERTANG
ncbi:MAG TPA: SNF2-related protein [Candidatus Hydrogenedentes bacterium]|nr:SNF2-related protein [Candidatus Hydrogenedentota bacterium]